MIIVARWCVQYAAYSLLTLIWGAWGLFQLSKIAAMLAAIGVPVDPAAVFRDGFVAYVALPATPIIVGVLAFRRWLKRRRERRQQWPDGQQKNRTPGLFRVFER